MKKSILKLSILGMSIFMFSCGNGGNTETENSSAETSSVEEGKECVYAYNADKTMVSWVAYKTTNKVGVGGEFLNFTIEGTKEASSPLEAIKGASITIPVSSVETKDEGRNQRIVEFFFGTFTDTEALTGTVKEVSTDGTGTLTLNMNGIEHDVPVKFTVTDALITAEATLDLNNWDGQAAIDALNEECKDLHAGEDGVTKLWPDVDIKITSELNKTCK